MSKSRVWIDPEVTREPDVAVYGQDHAPPPPSGGTVTLRSIVDPP